MARAVDRNSVFMDVREGEKHTRKAAKVQPVKTCEEYVLHLANADAAKGIGSSKSTNDIDL